MESCIILIILLLLILTKNVTVTVFRERKLCEIYRVETGLGKLAIA